MMRSLERFRLWWQKYTGEEDTPFDSDTPAWVLSLVLHVTVLLSLALIGLSESPATLQPITIVTEPVEHEELGPEFVSEPDELHQGDNSDVVLPIPDPPDVRVVELPDDLVDPSPNVRPEVGWPPVDTQNESVLEKGIAGRPDFAVGTSDASGAVDRLTVEIQGSLQQRPTLVCWVFDQSVSLVGQRRKIASRLDRVFDELGMNRAEKHRPDLLNLVFAYGQSILPCTSKPTAAVEDVVSAIETIPVDESGVERTFSAIRFAAERAQLLRMAGRRVMIVVFTDEVGNDPEMADEASRLCRPQGMSVYVVGVPAPFGMQQVKMKFVEYDPKYADGEQWAVVDQGPETLYPEFVRVHPCEADEPIDSGFGPFSLSKLCYETGGTYFAVHANRGAPERVSDEAVAPMASQLRWFFEPAALKDYRPDYVAKATIDKAIAANKAKQALVEAASRSQISPMESPTMTFPREDDGALVLLLNEAQKVAARLQPKIDSLYTSLAAGAVDRDEIEEKRWQAGYDLAMGRVLAIKVRTDAYNRMLAQAKTGMKFKDPKNDTWVLEASNDVSAAGSETAKLAKQCRTYLERVIKDHPGTPWAFLAAEELKTPLGYAWSETFTNVNKLKMGGGGGGNPNPADDKPRGPQPPPKPIRPPLKNL